MGRAQLAANQSKLVAPPYSGCQWIKVGTKLLAGLSANQQRLPPACSLVLVDVGVAHGAAIELHRMIELITVSVRRVLQLIQEVGDLAHVIQVEPRELRDLIRVLSVMR